MAREPAGISQLISAMEADTAIGRACRGEIHAAGGRAHALDRGVYVRSMSSRGRLGGLSRAAVDAVAVLDAAGYDAVIVETVGVGQADVEIVGVAHTTAVVSVPGLGDDIQALKAGLLEIADVHIVNKADRPESGKTIGELLTMLTLGGASANTWSPRVMGTVALTGEGVPQMVDALDEHLAWMRAPDKRAARERAAVAARVRAIARDLVIERMADPAYHAGFDEAVDAVMARKLDPYAAAARLIDRVAVPN
jgi:LAO/AO transport system kinase